MTLTRYLAVGACAAALVTGASAQTLRSNPQPAEFPPASYNGSQYVDSTGCVFIRAGVNGAVTWVPRVSRDRRQVCGQQPTQVAGAGATAQAAPAPVQIVPTAPVAQAAAPAPATVTAVRPAAPAPTTRAPMPTVATAIIRPAAPVVAPVASSTATATAVVVTKPSSAPRPAGQPVEHTLGGKCPNASDFSNRWVNDGTRGPVRCGPQDLPQVAQRQGGGNVAAGGDRILPAHVYANQFNTRNVAVPHGYAPVWTDDRLNPRRAEQTMEGHAQTQQIWTNTVPRRLLSPSAEVKLRTPRIVSRAEAGVTRAEAPVVSTRSDTRAARKAAAPAAAPAPVAETGSIYVQVGTFGVPANAQATAQRLAGTGLPVRMGSLTRGGTAYQLVLAGPFASRDQAQAALGTARRLGFADAYIR